MFNCDPTESEKSKEPPFQHCLFFKLQNLRPCYEELQKELGKRRIQQTKLRCRALGTERPVKGDEEKRLVKNTVVVEVEFDTIMVGRCGFLACGLAESDSQLQQHSETHST